MKVVYSPKFLEYSHPGHPESPQRLQLIQNEFKKDSVFEFSNPEPATEQDLLQVHSPGHIDSVKNLTFTDPDTPHFDNIYDIALLSAGSAIQAAQIVSCGHPEFSSESKKIPGQARNDTGANRFAFSLARPPGHHAGRNFLGGFCYFNNLAIAVSSLLQAPGVESNPARTIKRHSELVSESSSQMPARRSLGDGGSPARDQLSKIAILDLDVHHGNGTQDIFLGHNQVLFCSLHQSSLYPNSGLSSQDNCHNFTLKPGTKGSEYSSILDQALTRIKDFRPQLLAVSLGFDTYQNDPLASLKLTRKDYSQIGQQISQLKCPTFFVLEGGYSTDIGQCAWNFFKGVLKQQT
jgi:acetoin utilization deacetylase AcuC-like enzyme